MRNISRSRSDKALEVCGWLSLVIGILLMYYSLIKSTLALDLMLIDPEQYHHIKQITKDMFLAGATFTMLSIGLLFASNN